LICPDRQNPVGIAVVNETRLTVETRSQPGEEDRIFFRFISALQKESFKNCPCSKRSAVIGGIIFVLSSKAFESKSAS
jgi:hypothetical protein